MSMFFLWHAKNFRLVNIYLLLFPSATGVINFYPGRNGFSGETTETLMLAISRDLHFC